MSSNILVSIYLKRDLHENGMTLQEYADGVIEGTQPVLEHDEYVYQFGAVKDELDLVVDWAQKNSLTVFEAGVDIATVKVHGTQDQMGKLFSVELRTVIESDRTYITHDGEITIPSEINSVVDFVLGLDNSMLFENHLVVSTDTSISDEPLISNDVDNPMAYPTLLALRPHYVASAYQSPKGSAKGASIGIIALTNTGYVSGWNQTDVNLSFNRIGISPPVVREVLVDGATRSTTSDGETMMDIYCAGAAAGTGSNITVYMTPNGGSGFLDGILACANDTVNNPTVLSISWGRANELSGDFLGTGYQACVVKGITVFLASGDAGANNLLCGYSASNPYVVSSGGTRLYILNGTTLDREYVWNTSSSATGGGISKLFSLPSWQSGLTYQTYSITTGSGVVTSLQMRGHPDFSAPGDSSTGYLFYLNGVLNTSAYGGTSAAAPLLAGLFSKLNLLLGRRVGYVNPTLYAHPEVFNDVTQGNDGTIGNNAINGTQGYLTRTGWDPTTGWGSPNMSAIYALYKTTSNSFNFPKQNYDTRPQSGVLYPRITQGVR